MSFIIGANSAVGGGFAVDNSFRSNPGSNPRLHINALGTATDIDKWTFSCWFKRSTLSSSQYLLYAYTSGQEAAILLNSNDKLDWYNYPGGGGGQIITNRLFRDVSAWYHLVCSYDGDNGTAGNRMRIYINGVEETSFATDTNPSSGEDQLINSNVAHNIGLKFSDVIQNNFSGYLSEICFIDGQQLDPTSFGEFDEDSGIWKPIDGLADLTFGNNGFYQTYSNSGALGEDFSGNNKDFTSTNITAVDQSTDTPTNNFCTLNPLNVPASNQPTFSEGNLQSISISGAGSFGGSSTFTVLSGKWYLECKALNSTSSVGISYNAGETARTNNDATSSYEWNYKYNGTLGHVTDSSYGDSFTTNDIIGIALNLDDNELIFYKNGTAQDSGTPISITASQEYVIYHQDDTESGSNQSNFAFNFGSPPYTISSGNTDGNGYGNFEYAVPSGFLSLCTANLSESG